MLLGDWSGSCEINIAKHTRRTDFPLPFPLASGVEALIDGGGGGVEAMDPLTAAGGNAAGSVPLAFPLPFPLALGVEALISGAGGGGEGADPVAAAGGGGGGGAAPGHVSISKSS